MSRPGRRLTPALAAGLLLLAAAPAPAQPKQPSAAFLEGTEVFRRILFDQGFKPLGTFGDLKDPKHTILIMFGDASRLQEVPGGLRSFLLGGGAVFLATDKALGPVEGEVASFAGVRVSGRQVVCERENAVYRGLSDCPYLQTQPGASPDLFRGLTQDVASNIPSYLEPVFAHPLPTLATLPDGSHEERTGTVGRQYPIMVGGDHGAGRMLVLADHSIFINEMMLPDDDGNVEFTYNCLEWLRQRNDGGGERTNVLFLEDGVINTRFEVPIKDQLPNEVVDRILNYLAHHAELADKAVPALERAVDGFDRSNGFNRLFARWLRNNDMSPDGYLTLLLVGLAVLVVLYGCWKVGWKARFRPDLQGPLLSAALRRLAPAGGVTEQRVEALARGGSLWEPAHDAARECLASAGAPAGKDPPRAFVQGGWMRRWTTAACVKRLWRLAYGPPAAVSQARWRRLLRDMKELKAALADGTVRWQ